MVIDNAKSIIHNDFSNKSLLRKAILIEQRQCSFIGPILRVFYRTRILRPVVFRLLCITEGGPMLSHTLQILMQQYDVIIGIYSYGACLKPGVLPMGTRIGNYCSIADGLQVLRRNHPTNRLSQHPLFFNHKVGLIPEDTISSIAENPLCIGHDVWIGANVIITPGCKTIGNGAVVAAGAVVTKDVPAFAVVGGGAAKLIRWRFSEEIQKCIEDSQWWLRSLSELIEWMPLFEKPVDVVSAQSVLQKISTATKQMDII